MRGGKTQEKRLVLPLDPPVFPPLISNTGAYPRQQWGHHESSQSSHIVYKRLQTSVYIDNRVLVTSKVTLGFN